MFDVQMCMPDNLKLNRLHIKAPKPIQIRPLTSSEMNLALDCLLYPFHTGQKNTNTHQHLSFVVQSAFIPRSDQSAGWFSYRYDQQ